MSIGASDTRCIGLGVDVTDEVSVAGMAERVRDAFGAIDVLVNNAALYGTLQRKPFFEISGEEWDRVQAVNLKGAFLCAKAAFAHMRGRGGKIVNIASASAMSGSPLWLHYVASKGGMIAMTRGMARELGEHGITVNAVAPGFTLTEARRKVSGALTRWRWRRCRSAPSKPCLWMTSCATCAARRPPASTPSTSTCAAQRR